MRKELLHKINSLLQEETPFFILKEAGSSNVQMLVQQDVKLHQAAATDKASAVFSKFSKDDTPIFIQADQEFHFEIISKELPLPVVVIDETLETQSNYERFIKNAVEQISSTSLNKVVLSRSKRINHESNPVDLYLRTIDFYPGSNAYFFYHPAIGMWMGATPETLLKIFKGRLETMSLAGTKNSSTNSKVIWTEKEKIEQQIVTDYIKEQLERSGVRDLSIAEVDTSFSGSLAHLRSIITAQIGKVPVVELLNNLHPTPAVCGVPRTEAYQYILKNEGYDRSYYAGYMGLIDPEQDRQDYYVNLRCMQVFPDHALVYVGGGITLESIPEQEWLETVHKLQIMGRVLKN